MAQNSIGTTLYTGLYLTQTASHGFMQIFFTKVQSGKPVQHFRSGSILLERYRLDILKRGTPLQTAWLLYPALTAETVHLIPGIVAKLFICAGKWSMSLYFRLTMQGNGRRYLGDISGMRKFY